MINKFQQGGKLQDAIMLFVQGLALTLQADPLQVILIAQQNPEALKAAVQVYQQTQDMGQAAQAFQQSLQLKTQAAKHGAKLQYLKSLKNQCAEDEELVYYKKGGSIGCGCKKKEDGGEIDQKRKVVQKFKNDYSSKRVKDSEEDYFNGTADHKVYKPLKLKMPIKKQQTTGSVKKVVYKKLNQTTPRVEKNCKGSKMKLQKKGGEVCPKCGKVHKAGIGCTVAKFKMRGGVL